VGAALVPDYWGEVVMARQEKERKIRAAAKKVLLKGGELLPEKSINTKQVDFLVVNNYACSKNDRVKTGQDSVIGSSYRV